MSAEMGHRKRVRRYDEPGHCHELTFSCYRRMPLLTNHVWRSMLSVSVGRAVAGHGFRLVAFVYVPSTSTCLFFPRDLEAVSLGMAKCVVRTRFRADYSAQPSNSAQFNLFRVGSRHNAKDC